MPVHTATVPTGEALSRALEEHEAGVYDRAVRTKIERGLAQANDPATLKIPNEEAMRRVRAAIDATVARKIA